MRILTFTSLFPNPADRTLGIFIYQRILHVACHSQNTVCVVAPVPYFPSWLPLAKWKQMRKIPRMEQIGPLTVYHPRYFLVPKVSMYFHGLLMFLGSFPLLRKLHRQIGFDCIDAHYVYPDGFAAMLAGKCMGASGGGFGTRKRYQPAGWFPGNTADGALDLETCLALHRSFPRDRQSNACAGRTGKQDHGHRQRG